MVIYNVTSQLDSDIEAQWIQWMQDVHIPEMLATEQFTEVTILKIVDASDSENVSYAVQYACESLDHLQVYLDRFSTKLRQSALDAFGEKVFSFRTILKEFRTIKSPLKNE